MTPAEIADEIRAARDEFHRLVDGATTAELRRRGNGTEWTNDQLLFHMLFGYLVVRVLLRLLRGFSLLPPVCSCRYAQALNTVARPFHVISYVGSIAGARVLGHARMERAMDQVAGSLIQTLDHAGEKQSARRMHFPGRPGPVLSRLHDRPGSAAL